MWENVNVSNEGKAVCVTQATEFKTGVLLKITTIVLADDQETVKHLAENTNFIEGQKLSAPDEKGFVKIIK